MSSSATVQQRFQQSAVAVAVLACLLELELGTCQMGRGGGRGGVPASRTSGGGGLIDDGKTKGVNDGDMYLASQIGREGTSTAWAQGEGKMTSEAIR